MKSVQHTRQRVGCRVGVNRLPLQRGCKTAPPALIATERGGGLFLGMLAIQMAGPAFCWAMAFAGIIKLSHYARQLGEMVVEERFRMERRWKYWGRCGLLSGWNYWVMFVLVDGGRPRRASICECHWLPDVPTWVWAAVFCIIVMP
ncbi:hypothetical protein KCP73_04715 [Salmonella enterica subsp. enterica]|nr:hypothetical protein KCP73_04715 [Salmonella enterica subsp. enterica]